jgi:alpha-D-ribose 1-methylphosphonate 5-phosphate C-P lyase
MIRRAILKAIAIPGYQVPLRPYFSWQMSSTFMSV